MIADYAVTGNRRALECAEVSEHFGTGLGMRRARPVVVQDGGCHNCESGLISGSAAYSPEPLDQPAEGNVLV